MVLNKWTTEIIIRISSRKFTRISHIGDIIISRVMYDVDRLRMVFKITMTIKNYLAELNIVHFLSRIKKIDIPTSTNKYDSKCMAFMRSTNSLDHQMFFDRFNSRI